MVTSQTSGNPESGLGAAFTQGSGNPMLQEFILRSALGLEDSTEALWDDATLAGRTMNRSGYESRGIVELRLLPPTITSPISSLRLTTNGILSVTPEDLSLLGKFLSAAAGTVEKPFEEAMKMAANYDMIKMFMK